MFKLDDNFLIELGLGSLPAGEKNKMLSHIYETLEMKVGMRLAEKMSNEQLDEFEAFINRNDEAGALKWLESNFPNYKEVVAEELEKLKGEIRQVAPQIIAQAASTLPPAGSQAPPAQLPANSPYPPYTAPQQPAYSPQEPAALPPSPMPPAYPMPPAQPQFGAGSMPPQQDFGMPPSTAPGPMPAYDPAPIQQHAPYQPPAHHQPQPHQAQQFGAPVPQQPGFGGSPAPFQQPSQTFQPAQPDPFAMPAPTQNTPSYSQNPPSDQSSSFGAFDQQPPAAPRQPTLNFAQPPQQNSDASYGSTQPSAGFGMNNQFAGSSPAGMQQAQNPPDPYQPPR